MTDNKLCLESYHHRRRTDKHLHNTLRIRVDIIKSNHSRKLSKN